MHRFGVSKAVLSGLTTAGVNDFVIDIFRQNPVKIYPLPMLSRSTPEATDAAIAQFQMRGVQAVKIHPRLARVSLDDEWVENVLEICSTRGMAVFICTVNFIRPGEIASPISQIIGRLSARHPHVKIVLLHGGYEDVLATCERVRVYENVLVDLSATLARFYDSSVGLDIKYLCRRFDRRIVLGTDFPEYSYDDVKMALRYIGVDWDAAFTKGILGRNLIDFLEIGC